MNLILIHRHEIESTVDNTTEDDNTDNCDGHIDLVRKKFVKISYPDERYQHVMKHLQKKDGDIVRIGIVNESTGTATIRYHPNNNSIQEELISTDSSNSRKKKKKKHNEDVGGSMVLSDWTVKPLDAEALPKVELILGMMQPQTLKRLWPILSSLGICHVTIAGGDLCDEAYKHSSIITPKVYLPLIHQGLAQSTVPLLPTIDIQTTKPLCKIISMKQQQQPPWKKEHVVFIGLDVGPYPSIRTIVQQSYNNDDVEHGIPHVILLVGPERGYTEQEVVLMKQKGVQLASMGPWIQRTDVACITSISLAMDALRELQQSTLGKGIQRTKHTIYSKNSIKHNNTIKI